MKQKLLLRNNLAPGDVLMLTATVRDIYLAYHNKYEIMVETSCEQIWDNNPYITKYNYHEADDGEIIDDDGKHIICIRCNYPLVHQSNKSSYHFIHGFRIFLEDRLGLKIPATQFFGDIHLSKKELSWISQVDEQGIKDDFWIICAGGKYDFTAKWYNPLELQKVVDHFKNKITFVQVGKKEHWHPPLKNVINLIDKTDIRQLIRLVHHSVGVVCPITFAMHAAAAVPVKEGRPKNRACVVIAGGREPAQWEAYPHHRYLSTNGALSCCDNGGCWKARCQLVGDGDDKDKEENRCLFPVKLDKNLSIPKCMNMITSNDIIRNIEMYYDGGALEYKNNK